MTHDQVSLLIKEADRVDLIGEVDLSDQLFVPQTSHVVGRPELNLTGETRSGDQVQVFMKVY